MITREDVEEGLEKFGQEMKDALKKRTPRTLEEYMSTGAGSRLPDRDMQLTPEEQEEKKKLQERYAAYVFRFFFFPLSSFFSSFFPFLTFL